MDKNIITVGKTPPTIKALNIFVLTGMVFMSE